ncbi:MAG: lysophospholipid acyltransferase family protein [Nitriliruptoraceae bacterium]
MASPQLDARWRVLATVARTLRAVFGWRIRVDGLEHVPLQGGAVLAFNHHSHADFVMVGWATVVERRRPLRFVGKREVWDSRWVGWLPRLYDQIPVDRGSASGRAAAFDVAVDALRGGHLVAVAPEQTISASFELLPFRHGAARMARRAGVPIIPVVGWGTQRFSTKGIPLRLRRRLPVTVRFGPPVTVGPDDDPAAATARLRATMAALLDVAIRAYPDGTPPGAPWLPARYGGGAPTHDEVLEHHRRRTRRDWMQDLDADT